MVVSSGGGGARPQAGWEVAGARSMQRLPPSFMNKEDDLASKSSAYIHPL